MDSTRRGKILATARKRKRIADHKVQAAYRSKLEPKVAALLPVVDYEPDKLAYIVPASKHKYTPDFKLRPGVYIEVKGRLLPSERKKHILVKEQNPDVEIMFFFDRADNKIYKGSKKTYADWCDENGFKWTDLKRGLPDDWIK